MVSDVHGSVEALAARRATAPTPSSAWVTSSSSSTTTTPGGDLRRPVRGRERAPVHRAAHGGPLRRGACLGRGLWDELGVRDRRTGERSSRRRCASSTPSLSPRCRRRPTSPTATSTCPPCGRDYLRAGPPGARRRGRRDRRPRVGFVGGGLVSPNRTPYEVSDEAYAAKVAALGEVDVLCTHIPPGAAGADATTSSPAGSSAGARRCWRTSARSQPRLALLRARAPAAGGPDPHRAAPSA